ncbi:laminin [Opitutaceae bacterium TAV5]|nr:laminin [Opitutaceae bacterium TAV5]
MLRFPLTLLLLSGGCGVSSAALPPEPVSGSSVSKEETFVDYIFDAERQVLRDRWGRQPDRPAPGIAPVAETGGAPALRPQAGKPVRLTGLDLPAGPLTLSLWVRPDAPLSGAPQVIRASGSVLTLGIDGQNRYQVTRSDDDRRPQSATAAEPVGPGRWQHLAATHDGVTLALYVDGRLVATQSCRGRKTSHSDSGEALGSRGDGSNPFRGLIAAYAVYNRAFTAAEIAALARSFHARSPDNNATIQVRSLSSL